MLIDRKDITHGRRDRDHIRRPTIRIAALATALLAGITGPVLVAEPAAASIPGLVRVTQTSPATDSDKTVTVRCPFGTKLLSAGGYISDGGGKVAMDDIFPDENFGFVNVTGLETDPYTVPWRVTAVAMCSAALVGLEWIDAPSASDATDFKTATARCSYGKTLLGSGATVLGGDGVVFLDEIVPNGGAQTAATEVKAEAVEGDPYGFAWSVTAFAICAYPRAGQQVEHDTTPSDQLDKGTFKACTGANQVATGGSAEIIGGLGEVVMDDSHPSSTTATTVYGHDNDGNAPTWSIRAYTLCADA